MMVMMMRMMMIWWSDDLMMTMLPQLCCKLQRWWATCDVDIRWLFVLPVQDQRTKRQGGREILLLVSPKNDTTYILYIIGYNSNISKSANGKEDLTPENAQIYSNAAKGSAPSILSCGFLQKFARWFGWPFWSSRGEGAQNCLVFWMMVGGEWGERNRDFKCVFTFICFLSI